jgi:hypothetical protein
LQCLQLKGKDNITWSQVGSLSSHHGSSIV